MDQGRPEDLTSEQYADKLRERHPGAVLLVEFDGGTSGLATFAEANVDCPDVVEELLKVPMGLGVCTGIGGGWSDPYRLLQFLPRTGETVRNHGSAEEANSECLCGNTPGQDGYTACDAHGADQTDEHLAPLPSWDGKHLKCGQCWRVFRQGEAADQPVIGRVAPRACTAPTCNGMGADVVTGEECQYCNGEWTSPEDDTLSAEDAPYAKAVAEHLGHDAAARSATLNRIYTGQGG